jgi:hypothetical protein
MSKDIVEQLREYAEDWQIDRSVVDRAANEIERLRALVEASIILAHPGLLTVNCVRGSVSCQEAKRLRSRVEELEAALKPFAALPLWPDAAGDLASEFIESETDLSPVARNDIRAARAALEAKP